MTGRWRGPKIAVVDGFHSMVPSTARSGMRRARSGNASCSSARLSSGFKYRYRSPENVLGEWELLTEKYGAEPVRAREFFEPVLINAFEAEVLHVPIGSAAMLAERIAYSAADVPIEFNRSVLRGDICRFSIDMHKGGFRD